MKGSNFKILWRYLKHDKLKLSLYVILLLFTYLPAMLTPVFEGLAIENLIEKNMNGFTMNLAIMISINIMAWSILQIPRDFLYNYLEIKFMKNVSKDLYKKIDKLPAVAFEEIGVGEFINRLYTDPDRVMELLNKMIKLICKSIIVLVVFYLAFSISIILGIEITIFAITMGFISYKFFPKIKHTQEKIKKESDKYVKEATENLTGIREIKALGIKRVIEKNIFNTLDTLYKNTTKIRKYEVIYHNSNNFIYFTLEFIILLTSGYFLIHGKISYGIFIMLENYIWRIDEVVESISEFGISYNKVKVSLKRIDEILNNRLYDDEKFGDVELNDCKGVIKFNDVHFKYREKEKKALTGLTMEIEPNKKVAIVGRSGNGKSTLFNLLLRYFDANKGTIKIDGINIQDLTEESLRDNISIIRQAPFLFNLSILDNFRLVDDNVTLEEVREVCKRAYIDDYIMSLPLKYETVIGEGGINLSGGQKQRIAIARTLLTNTKIILFDEATSALDNESQEFIKKTIDELVKDHTVIIVAHRLSTIIDADIINVIEKGKLVASGKHNKLLKTSEAYKNLYTSESLNS